MAGQVISTEKRNYNRDKCGCGRIIRRTFLFVSADENLVHNSASARKALGKFCRIALQKNSALWILKKNKTNI
jgi:hypothetical protein